MDPSEDGHKFAGVQASAVCVVRAAIQVRMHFVKSARSGNSNRSSSSSSSWEQVHLARFLEVVTQEPKYSRLVTRAG
jgi:hypothetical protein